MLKIKIFHAILILAICIFLFFILSMVQRWRIREAFETIPRVIYVFWTGSNPMNENRKKSIESIRETSGCQVILITKDNLNTYIIKDHPLHPAYPYLSEVHKADYLRTYFMHFYGGGYSDVKPTSGNWLKAFEDMEKNPSYYANGYKEVGPGGVGYAPNAEHWEKLIGNCAYIFRPNTSLTKEWYNDMIKLLDSKLEELKQHPASHPRDKKEENTGYPIGWIEMLGEIFHRVIYNYHDKLLMTVPIPNFSNYS